MRGGMGRASKPRLGAGQRCDLEPGVSKLLGVIDISGIRTRFEALAPFLDERGRRLFTASEARAAGRGGVTAVATATRVARSTIGRGLAELRLGRDDLGSRIRRPGGGRKPAVETQPGLLEALGELVQSAIRGDPEAALLWVSKSQRHLARALTERGFAAGQKLVGRLLRRLGFSLQANRKTREGTSHPDRDAQFEYINARVKAWQTAGQPAISVDTKKKELVGDFKNGGRELRPKGQPEAVRVHDFALPDLGKVAPYGVESIRRWWRDLGRPRYPTATRLLITADCGGSNGVRVRLWKRELQGFADETGLSVTVAHLPPGTSKWNRIEHRLFAFITQNWRGKPLLTHQVIVQLIASTTTRTGLTVRCRLDRSAYAKGVRVSDAEMAALNLQPAAFHGDWNDTIRPRQPTD